MKFLLDTNVLSELRKGARANAEVRSWYSQQAHTDLCLSVLVQGEIRKGIEQIRSRDLPQARVLEAWLSRTTADFDTRILPIDGRIAEMWGHLNAVNPIAIVDGLMAATAIVHGLTLVTRNVRDFQSTRVPLLNPFEPAGT